MSIINSYAYKLDDGIEQYAFSSELNPKQTHFVDRVDGGPWELSIVNFGDSLSLKDALTLKSEIEALCGFMAGLATKQIRRRTEPGAPSFEEGI